MSARAVIGLLLAGAAVIAIAAAMRANIEGETYSREASATYGKVMNDAEAANQRAARP